MLLSYNDHYMSNDSQTHADSSTAVDNKTEPPKFYKVLMHNDDYSTMEFVIHVLMKFFNKTSDQAHQIMFKIHHEGIGICGVYTKEIAESKTVKTNRYSREKGFPLRCTFEACED